MIRHRIFRSMLWTVFALPAVLGTSCSQALLKELTPYVIDGSNGFMREFIFTAAPLVLP